MIRQGNENKKAFVYSYVTEKTFDAYMYQLVEQKQKFIFQIMTSKTPARTMEDIDEKAQTIEAREKDDNYIVKEAENVINNYITELEMKSPKML